MFKFLKRRRKAKNMNNKYNNLTIEKEVEIIVRKVFESSDNKYININ